MIHLKPKKPDPKKPDDGTIAASEMKPNQRGEEAMRETEPRKPWAVADEPLRCHVHGTEQPGQFLSVYDPEFNAGGEVALVSVRPDPNLAPWRASLFAASPQIMAALRETQPLLVVCLHEARKKNDRKLIAKIEATISENAAAINLVKGFC